MLMVGEVRRNDWGSTSTTQTFPPRMQSNSERIAGCVVAVHQNHLKQLYYNTEFRVWSSCNGRLSFNSARKSSPKGWGAIPEVYAHDTSLHSQNAKQGREIARAYENMVRRSQCYDPRSMLDMNLISHLRNWRSNVQKILVWQTYIGCKSAANRDGAKYTIRRRNLGNAVDCGYDILLKYIIFYYIIFYNVIFHDMIWYDIKWYDILLYYITQ